jgi:hypothetical protein
MSYLCNIIININTNIMNTNQKVSQKVMKCAWTIFKAGLASSFSIALKRAWVIIKLQSGEPRIIEFAKDTTGEYRKATAVLTGSLDTLEKGFVKFVELVEGKAQWRSFRIENLLVA